MFKRTDYRKNWVWRQAFMRVTALNANGETRMQALRRKDEATGLWWKTKCKR